MFAGSEGWEKCVDREGLIFYSVFRSARVNDCMTFLEGRDHEDDEMFISSFFRPFASALRAFPPGTFRPALSAISCQ